eukprot:CAMPEP_0184666098 /NCGR_PEP_ID=MMETSP0308-20130426/60050_1 /TAXON_ID=38269 /ORGANISM="Gloeochaete witrockiana, Strain SAG 46.84" /LENGTH=186 /DNA_ID=CAMNT_0027110517 /DNA_START=244 /DNA_END=804 /DNA_ORIENTATION=+
MDLLGCITVGTITAIGGGTIRDILLGRRVFWMDGEWEYLILSAGTAILTFFLWPWAESQKLINDDDEFLQWSDAMGLGAFCVIGAHNGIRAGLHPICSILCGMFTATFGGLTRDVLCRRPVRILHSNREIYASTALGGALAYVILHGMKVPLGLRIAGGFTTAVLLRYAAWRYDIRLPTWESQQKP